MGELKNIQKVTFVETIASYSEFLSGILQNNWQQK